MFENIISIDAGTSSIKMVSIRTGFRDFSIKAFAFEEIDPDKENHEEALKEAISRILQDVDTKDSLVLTNLPMEKTIIRNILFPFSDISKISEAIPYEAEENIPFKLDDVILDFQSLQSPDPDDDPGGWVMLAAAHKQIISDFLATLNEHGINPAAMGMESTAIFECYHYFNKISDESIVQLDIGHSKTIMNIVSSNNLLYTRSIPAGIGHIHKAIAAILGIPRGEAVKTYDALNLDLTSLENNIQRGFYSNLKISKTNLKRIYEEAVKIIGELNEQIFLTIKAFTADHGTLNFNRIILSGGGSNLQGIGSLISREIEAPAVALPFLDEYREVRIRTQFPAALGTILSYLKKRRGTINFLKGEFTPDSGGHKQKIYYLSGAFAVAAIIIYILNFIITLIIISGADESNRQLLEERYTKYFGKPPAGKPVENARNLLREEKQKIESIVDIMPEDLSMMKYLRDILTNFVPAEEFELRNIVIDKNIIRFDGASSDSSAIDEFRSRLLATGNYESVSLNIRSSSRERTLFTMTIRLKTG